MRVKVLKPWTIEGYTYSRIGEVLEVEDRYALRGIFDGYAEDIAGKIKPVVVKKEIKLRKENKDGDN